MKLKDFVKLSKEKMGTDVYSPANIDYFFCLAGEYGIKELQVSEEEIGQ